MKRHSREPPAEEVDEERGADNGGHGADGKFAGGDDGARQGIREYDGKGSADGGRRQQKAVVRAKDETHQMRDDQADVADGGADGDGPNGQGRSSEIDDQ